jgi:hypothetical protein
MSYLIECPPNTAKEATPAFGTAGGAVLVGLADRICRHLA